MKIKEIFQAKDLNPTLNELEDEVQEMMEVIAEEYQINDGDDENALEAFEIYVEIRKKVLERK